MESHNISSQVCEEQDLRATKIEHPSESFQNSSARKQLDLHHQESVHRTIAHEVYSSSSTVVDEERGHRDIKKKIGSKSMTMLRNVGNRRVCDIYLSRPIRKPWITKEFIELILKRDELHSKFKKDPANAALTKEYITCRNQTAAMRRKLKMAYQLYLEEL